VVGADDLLLLSCFLALWQPPSRFPPVNWWTSTIRDLAKFGPLGARYSVLACLVGESFFLFNRWRISAHLKLLSLSIPCITGSSRAANQEMPSTTAQFWFPWRGLKWSSWESWAYRVLCLHRALLMGDCWFFLCVIVELVEEKDGELHGHHGPGGSQHEQCCLWVPFLSLFILFSIYLSVVSFYDSGWYGCLNELIPLYSNKRF
jgi:hypothetical protein